MRSGIVGNRLQADQINISEGVCSSRNSEFVVIDLIRIPGIGSPWVLGHVRAGEDVVTREIEAAGFELVERLGFKQTEYYLRFRKWPDR